MKFKEIRVLDCSHYETTTPHIAMKENYKFEFVYSEQINKIKAYLTSSVKNPKFNESLTDKRDLVYTPKTLNEVVNALNNTVLTDDNINMYCKGAPITMDRKTLNIPFVFDNKIQNYENFIAVLATQFSANKNWQELKTQCYKIYTANKIEEDTISN